MAVQVQHHFLWIFGDHQSAVSDDSIELLFSFHGFLSVDHIKSNLLLVAPLLKRIPAVVSSKMRLKVFFCKSDHV